jgi:tRNA uridine 5-carboxymethylaminomethyl modification enzyme
MSLIECLLHEQSIETLLRQDNADLRLTAKSHSIGLASSERLAKNGREENRKQAKL